MKIVALDNHALVWGIRQVASPGQENMIPRATALFEALERDRAQVLVPMPVVSEFLAPVDINDHQHTLEALATRFRPIPYDLPAARQAAVIWQEARVGQSPVLPELCDEVGKQRVKVDIQILAIAITRGADILYTHDSALRKLAGRIGCAQSVQAVELPVVDVQLQFGEDD